MSDIEEINSEENSCQANSMDKKDNHINLNYLIIPLNQYLIDMYDDDMSSYAKFPEMKLINQLRSDYKSIKNKEPYSIRYFGCLNHPKARMIKVLKNNLYDQYYMIPYTLDDDTPKMVTAPSNNVK